MIGHDEAMVIERPKVSFPLGLAFARKFLAKIHGGDRVADHDAVRARVPA
ncbi:hypothetical protein AB0F36_27590 [Streptomyces sp. NPDC029080]